MKNNDLISRSDAINAVSSLMPSLTTPDGTGNNDNEIISAQEMCVDALQALHKLHAVDAVPVVHGQWILEAHNEHVNYRWNVTSECSKCHSETKEIWRGFFPNFYDSVASEIALDNARRIELKKYCPDCGARMDGKDDENEIN